MKRRSTIKFLESQFNLYLLVNCFLAIIMILLGIVLYVNPSIAIKTVSWLIGIFFLIQGILAILSYIKKDELLY